MPWPLPLSPVLTSVAEPEKCCRCAGAIPATGRSIFDREDVKAVVADVEAEAQERICCICSGGKSGPTRDAWPDAEQTRRDGRG